MTPVRRSVRLNQIKELLRGRKGGLTVEELARMTGVTPRSIQRDLITIESEDGVPLVNDKNRYALMREERLSPLDLTLQEARAVLIATRLFLRYSDECDAFAATALKKLAQIMPQAVRAQVRAAAESLSERPLDLDFTRNLSAVTDAWARGRYVRISYRSAGKQRAKEVIVAPYFLEPSAAGFATYLIGYSRTHQQIRTFKIERIVSAEMLPEHFEMPADLQVDELLSSAWGIIWGEGIVVQLRFAADVAWRVKESRWHPSQSIDELPDGSCLMKISVASVMELGRWVRGWGDKVEVLSPRELREELRDEAVRLARMYTRKPKAVPRRRSARVRAAAAPGMLPLPG